MKKIITFSVICIMASILLSSCGSSISIAKRHYNNGYYISYNNGKQAVTTPKEEEKVVQAKSNDPLSFLKNQKEQNTLNGYSSQSSISDDAIASTGKIQQKSVSQKRIKQALKQKIKITEHPASQLKNTLFKLKKIRSGPMVEEGGYSLFWLVILAILILWALGLLVGGWGGLVNILLVLALILFILWLLKFI